MNPGEFQSLVLEDLGEAVEVVLGRPGRAGSPADQSGECIVAVVSFSGDHIRGAVGIRLPIEVARVTHPNPEESHELIDLGDWAAEISNQCLGGIKARLSRRGHLVWCSTPVTLTGLRVQLIGECISRTLTYDEGEAVVWVQISWWEQPVDPKSTEIMMPGDMALF